MSERKVEGMTTCKICGRDFPLIVERRYTAIDNSKSGIVMTFAGVEEILYDAIDCPHCGCQNILQPRKRVDAFVEMEDAAKCCGCCGEREEEQ